MDELTQLEQNPWSKFIKKIKRRQKLLSLRIAWAIRKAGRPGEDYTLSNFYIIKNKSIFDKR